PRSRPRSRRAPPRRGHRDGAPPRGPRQHRRHLRGHHRCPLHHRARDRVLPLRGAPVLALLGPLLLAHEGDALRLHHSPHRRAHGPGHPWGSGGRRAVHHHRRRHHDHLVARARRDFPAPLPELIVIEYRDVWKAFDVPVLSGIDLTVADGEMLSIVGPSGTGKSVLLKTTNGLLVP